MVFLKNEKNLFDFCWNNFDVYSKQHLACFCLFPILDILIANDSDSGLFAECLS